MSSDSTQPLNALVYPFDQVRGASFGTVWDGTKSTGAKYVPYTGDDVPLLIWTLGGTNAQTINVEWAFTALDAHGKDVGLTCVD